MWKTGITSIRSTSSLWRAKRRPKVVARHRLSTALVQRHRQLPVSCFRAAILSAWVVISTTAWADVAATRDAASISASAKPPAAVIATAHPLATEAGRDILNAGGNAFDAAVAISAALAVTEPTGSGLGGGGFYLLHRASDARNVFLDARETAPAAAHRDMYLDKQGHPVKGLSWDGPLAAGIPGIPAALAHLAKHYGKLPLPTTLAPAIRLAREGFPVDDRYRAMAKFRRDALTRSPEAARTFLVDGDIPATGTVIYQPELATTLDAIAKDSSTFYGGPLADRLVAAVKAAGGIWSKDDLANYRIIEREPLRGQFRGITVISAPPPSSGGVALLTMLNILSGFDSDKLDEVTRTHLTVEAMRRAFRDRTIYLGDPDFVQVPVERLTHPFYADGLRAAIRPDRATKSAALPGVPDVPQGSDTTHFSVLDRDGNRIAATLSVNLPFGSGFVAGDTGILLNNEMDDFSVKPGVPNAYGLIGEDANAIAPGKRPLSSMTPTFLETEDRVGILGTPGGSRIITMVLLSTLEFAAGTSPDRWVSRARYHHQFVPDVIQHETDALSDETKSGLLQLGHELKPVERNYGNMQVILWDRKAGTVQGASDPRGIGSAVRIPQHP